MWWTLPNGLSGLRLLSAPFLVVLIHQGLWTWAFWGILLASLTDWMDGFLARRLHHESPVGAWLDPLADKMLLMTLFITLGAVGILPLTLIALCVLRDLLIMGGVLVLKFFHKPLVMKPLTSSKLNTALQMLLVITAVGLQAYPAALPLGDPAAAFGLWPFFSLLGYATGLTTLISFIHYMRIGWVAWNDTGVS